MSGGDDIQRLADYHAISDLAVRYCSAVDRRDWDLLAEVFLPDATVRLPPSVAIRGSHEIVSRYRRGLERFDATHHMVSNHEIAVDGDSARHTCLVHAQHVLHDAPGGSTYVIGGRSPDQMVRTRQGWRIAHRELAFIWTEGNPSVFRTNPDTRRRAEP
ncbi:MAG: nuclear transport factor 2 family protein [Acidimicrobiaceae bacterium]|nr:nuclear transport factor 2 family protein [Acidimicrobiaceae bacterium]